jgi:hypothetical protein
VTPTGVYCTRVDHNTREKNNSNLDVYRDAFAFTGAGRFIRGRGSTIVDSWDRSGRATPGAFPAELVSKLLVLDITLLESLASTAAVQETTFTLRFQSLLQFM